MVRDPYQRTNTIVVHYLFSVLFVLLLIIGTNLSYVSIVSPRPNETSPAIENNDPLPRSTDPDYWEDDTRVTYNISSSKYPDFAIDKDGNHHVVWQDDRNGNWEVYYLKLSNHGDKLINDMRITNDNFTSLGPKVIIDETGENIHILWEDDSTGCSEVYLFALHYSAENIITVSDKISISDDDGYSSRAGDMAFDSEARVHFAWEDNRNGNWDIYYALTDADGNPLTCNTILSDSRYNYTKCSLDVDPETGDTSVAYLEFRNLTNPIDPNYGLQFIKVDAFGQMISRQERFSIVSGAARPKIMMDRKGNSHIVFDDTRYNEINKLDIFYTMLGTTGSTIIDDICLTEGPQEGTLWHNSSEPSLVVDTNDQVHVIWMNEIDGPCTPHCLISRIFYTLLDPYNFSVQKPIPPKDQITLIENRKISSDTSGALEPSIALDMNNNIHLLWQDNRNDNWELYYKKTNKPDITYGPPGIRLSSSSPISGEEIEIYANITDMRDSGNTLANCTFYYIEKSDWARLILTADLKTLTPVLEELDANGVLVHSSYPAVPPFGYVEITAVHNTAGMVGDYELVLVIDPRKVLEETNEENNIINTSIFIRDYSFNMEAVDGTELTAEMRSGYDSVPFDLKVFNSGNSVNTINFTISGNFTDTVIADLSVPPGEAGIRTVRIDVPGETLWGCYNFSVEARSIEDVCESGEVRMSLWVEQYHAVTVVASAGMDAIPKKECSIPINITNAGNGDDLLEVLLAGNQSWLHRFVNGNVSDDILIPSYFLPLGGSWELELFILVPNIAPGSSETFTFNVNSKMKKEKISSSSITLTVLPMYEISMAVVGQSDVSFIEDKQDFQIRIENTGNVPCNYTISLPEVNNWTEGRMSPISIWTWDAVRPSPSAPVLDHPCSRAPMSSAWKRYPPTFRVPLRDQ